MRRTKTPKAETVDLSPEEFAELLGLTQSDAPFLATATVRLPALWVEGWRARLGVRELTVSDICVVLGVCRRSVSRYLHKDAKPRLSFRLGASAGAHECRLVSPANLVIFLRERSRLAGACPVIRETKGQETRRGIAARDRALELCGGK